MAQARTVAELLQNGLLQNGNANAPAVLAPERPPLTFAALRDHLERTRQTLNGFGLGRNDRLALVLPNGPEMATAFLSVATAATTAPLNPAYRANEFDFYLADLDVRAMIVQTGLDSPAIAVARQRGIPIIELTPALDRAAGLFTLNADLRGAPAAAGPAAPDDVALVLHTSGTTSRPKIVPLLQRNICASAAHIRDALQLTPADRCLNLMPLFHIHGLMAPLLAGLGAGGAAYCSPGFSTRHFFSWLADARPTWYSAVPTMHQYLLTRASHNTKLIATSRLRLIRSSSASLPPTVMAELEETFRAPVIESYGMTEAAHQMTSNPLPPADRKPGSVGLAAGPQIAVMNAAGALQPAGAGGEVVIRGPNVTPGYEQNPQANADAFRDGWFRTGDQGRFDADGYLTITGRLKELINRGGEKISPRETDEALLAHPAVAQAVTFAVPHDQLGEEVAAAVVLRAGHTAGERELQEFAAQRLADFKVPRMILILDEIPTGATGKLQRIGLAEKLGLT